MSLSKNIQHIREIEYLSDSTSDSLHDAGTKTVQNFLSLERYIGSGILEGGKPGLNTQSSRIQFTIPIKGLVNGHRVYFDSTNEYTITSVDSTGFIWLDVNDDLQETHKAPDSTTGLLLWSFRTYPSGKIREIIDERNVISDTLNRFTYYPWKGYYNSFDDVPKSGFKNGDVIIVQKKIYVWHEGVRINTITDSYWQECKSTKFVYKVFKFFNVEGTIITPDSTADTLTFVEGRNIRFATDNSKDDATIFVFISSDLDMNDFQIRRAHLVDATGEVHVKGTFTLHEKLRTSNINLPTVKSDLFRVIQGVDSTTTTSIIQTDSTLTVKRLKIIKGDITANQIFTVDGDVNVTGNIDVRNINGVVPDDHHYRHEHPSVNPSIDGAGADQISLTGLSGVLRDKQNAIQIQGINVSSQSPSEGDNLTYDGSQWTPSPDTSQIDFLEALAIFNWGFGRDNNFENLTNHIDSELRFDRTNSWEVIHISDVIQEAISGTRRFAGGTFDGEYVYFTRDQINYHVRFKKQSPLIPENFEKSNYINWGLLTQACFDGQYVYFTYGTYDNGTYRKLIRFNTKSSSPKFGRSAKKYGWKDSTAWEIYPKVGTLTAYDLESLIFDGRYIYMLAESGNSYLLRYDTKKPFDGRGIETLSSTEKYGFQQATSAYLKPMFDGRYVYYMPQKDGDNIIRFDTELEWRYGFGLNDQTCWSTVSTNFLQGRQNDQQQYAKALGAAFDGRYLYFTPKGRGTTSSEDTTTFARLDVTKDWSLSSSWDYMDFDDVFGEKLSPSVPFYGATFDGRYIYYAPYACPYFVRFDTKKRFNDTSAWSLMNYKQLTGKTELSNFIGCIYDGMYVYFVPYSSDYIVRVKAFPCGGMFSRWGE